MISERSPQLRLDAVPRGAVRVVGAPDVSQALGQLEVATRARTESRRVVARTWDDLPGLDVLIDDALEALATSAASLWPAWYGRDSVDAGPSSPSLAPSADHRTVSALAEELRSLAASWAEAAFACCRAAQMPLVRAVPRAVQAEQLVLALDPEGLVLVLGCVRADPPDARLSGLARAAAWLAGETRARVVVIVPERLLASAALEPVLYGAVRLADEVVPTSDEKTRDRICFFPVAGRPHPMSPGEQRLAARLARDPELGGLFACNQRVRTSRGSEPLVDLLWDEGRLVVEIDGYRGHSDPWAFRADRQRDYELLASGYRVLRVTHDEVMEDVEIAVEKIRDIVRLCRPTSLRSP